MAEFVDRVVNVLADFKVTLTAASELVVEGVRQFGKFGLRNQLVGDPAQILDGAVIEESPRLFAEADAP